ncbi:MAG: hypothetical protein EBS01_12080, partial [Verrucomicrobia bacterium]|nr:hypothetical protein [Verrucomicrobiota bacterium]
MKESPLVGWGAFMRSLPWAAALGLGAHVLTRAEDAATSPASLQEITITADRLTPLSSGILSRALIRDAPERSLDGILRQAPGFSLFRRSDSLSAHPTSQGMSLGNTGPNGASRVALLLDGIPMNDPFGGWVPWSRLPAVSMAKVTLTPNGQPGLSAPGPLCGTVALESRFLADRPFSAVELSSGNQLRSQGSCLFAEDLEGGRTRLFGGISQTDFTGYKLIRRSQLGPIDNDAYCLAKSFDAGVRHRLSPDGDWNITVRTQGWSEKRGNGTPLANNRSEALDFSLRLERQAAPDEWSAQWGAFHQRRDFSSTFTSIGAGRASESLTLDQYAVPSTATGLLQQWRLPAGEAHTLALASDLVFTEGKTRERFRNFGAGFTREREAGGQLQIRRSLIFLSVLLFFCDGAGGNFPLLQMPS